MIITPVIEVIIMTRRNELTGKRFGELTVVERGERLGVKVAWLCRCSCGKLKIIRGGALQCGNTRSCGCLRKLRPSRLRHGRTRTKEYRAWQAMKNRCYWKKHGRWKHYGGRGIKVCKRWRHSFENFYTDVGPAPSKKHSIDRKRVNGHYYPSNVHWATSRQQEHNKQRHRR